MPLFAAVLCSAGGITSALLLSIDEKRYIINTKKVYRDDESEALKTAWRCRIRILIRQVLTECAAAYMMRGKKNVFVMMIGGSELAKSGLERPIDRRN